MLPVARVTKQTKPEVSIALTENCLRQTSTSLTPWDDSTDFSVFSVVVKWKPFQISPGLKSSLRAYASHWFDLSRERKEETEAGSRDAVCLPLAQCLRTVMNLLNLIAGSYLNGNGGVRRWQTKLSQPESYWECVVINRCNCRSGRVEEP